MKPICLYLSMILFANTMFAQKPQTITLDNNRTSADIINPELQYLFPDFQSGRVVLKDKKIIKCQLNYNFLTDEVLFIDETGKEMALANPQDVQRVYIGNRLFITISKGYYEVIENELVSLLYKWKCNIAEKGKEGALGITTDAPSVYQMNQISFDSRTWSLDVDKEVEVSVEVIPYLKTRSKCVLIKGAKEYLKAFSDKRSEIKLYLGQNPVDFKKEEDLRRLTKYCNSL